MELRRVNDRLKKANGKLKLQKKEIEEMSYIVSHDLQQPVRSISGFAEMLHAALRDSLPDEGAKHLDFIRGSAKRMAELLHS